MWHIAQRPQRDQFYPLSFLLIFNFFVAQRAAEELNFKKKHFQDKKSKTD